MYFSLFRFFHVSFGLVIIVAIAVCKSIFLVRLIFFASLLSIFFNFLALYLFEEVMQQRFEVFCGVLWRLEVF
jgi:hypothetical protein